METSVRVAARLRPLTPIESKDGCMASVYAIPESHSVVIGSGSAEKSFGFDYVFSSDKGNKDIYDACVLPLLTKALEGFNATIFAYGQTGSGKTFTMMEGYEDIANPRNSEILGISPRLIVDLFANLKSDSSLLGYELKVSCMEIYNEQVYDLLGESGAKTAKNVIIRDNADGNQVVIGLTEVPVASPVEVAGALARGLQARVTASTNMNMRSSRSHAIFTITVEQTIAGDDEGAMVRRSSQIHLVDLAGSERAKKTGAEGARLKEAASINRGLLALGNVISALAGLEDEGKDASGTHIPYRDSKLTRMLKSSLGGNAHTLMIACCSPADANIDETLSTLRYASRARQIKNKAVVNTDPMTGALAELRKQVKELQEALLAARAVGNTAPPQQPRLPVAAETDEASLLQLQMAEERVLELAGEVVRLQDELSDVNEDYAGVVEQLAAAEQKRDFYGWFAQEAIGVLKRVRDAGGAADAAILSDLSALLEKSQTMEGANAVPDTVAIDFTYVDGFLDDIADLKAPRPIVQPSAAVASTAAFTAVSADSTPDISMLETPLPPSESTAAPSPSSHDFASLRSQYNEVTRMLSQKTKLLQASTMQTKALGSQNNAEHQQLTLRLKQMESELTKLTQERNALQHLLEQKAKIPLEPTVVPTSTIPETSLLSTKLREADEKISVLQKQIKDASKKASLVSKVESRSESLTAEIQQLQRSRALMQRQMKEAAEKARQERTDAQRQAAKAEFKAEKAELELQRATKQLMEEQAKARRIHEEMVKMRRQREERNRALVHNKAELAEQTHKPLQKLLASCSSVVRDASVAVNIAQSVAGSLAGTRDVTFTTAVGRRTAASSRSTREDEWEDCEEPFWSLCDSMLGAKGHRDMSPELKRKLEGVIGGTVTIKRASALVDSLQAQRKAVMQQIEANAAYPQALEVLEAKRFALSNQIAVVNDAIITLNGQLDALRGAGHKRSNKALGVVLTDMPTCIKAITWLINLATDLATKNEHLITAAKTATQTLADSQRKWESEIVQERVKALEAERRAADIVKDSNDGIFVLLQEAVAAMQKGDDVHADGVTNAMDEKLTQLTKMHDEHVQMQQDLFDAQQQRLADLDRLCAAEKQLEEFRDAYETLRATQSTAAPKGKQKAAARHSEEEPIKVNDFEFDVKLDQHESVHAAAAADDDGEESDVNLDDADDVYDDDDDDDDYDEEQVAKRQKAGKGRKTRGDVDSGVRRTSADSFEFVDEEDAPRPTKRSRRASHGEEKHVKDFCGCTKDCSSMRCACKAAGRPCTDKCKKCKDCKNGKCNSSLDKSHHPQPDTSNSVKLSNDEIDVDDKVEAVEVPLSGQKRPRSSMESTSSVVTVAADDATAAVANKLTAATKPATQPVVPPVRPNAVKGSLSSTTSRFSATTKTSATTSNTTAPTMVKPVNPTTTTTSVKPVVRAPLSSVSRVTPTTNSSVSAPRPVTAPQPPSGNSANLNNTSNAGVKTVAAPRIPIWARSTTKPTTTTSAPGGL